MPPLAYYVHDLGPFVPFLHGENFGVRWYGLAYVLGFFGAAWLLQRYARAGRSLLPADKVWDLMIALIIGVFVGGRLGSFLLYHPENLLQDPLSFFRVWEGGMASHGGFVGVAVALGWFARSQKISFLHLADIVVSTAPLGLFLGRVANFINGELWGKPATVAWAVIFPHSPTPLMPRHPSQLYEAALEGLVLLAYMQWRVWRTNFFRHPPGSVAGEFLVGYAIVRVIGEVFREPDAELVFGIFSRGTFYSFFLLLAGVVLLALARRKPAAPVKHP